MERKKSINIQSLFFYTFQTPEFKSIYIPFVDNQRFTRLLEPIKYIFQDFLEYKTKKFKEKQYHDSSTDALNYHFGTKVLWIKMLIPVVINTGHMLTQWVNVSHHCCWSVTSIKRMQRVVVWSSFKPTIENYAGIWNSKFTPPVVFWLVHIFSFWSSWHELASCLSIEVLHSSSKYMVYQIINTSMPPT